MWFCNQFKVLVKQTVELNNMTICGQPAIVPEPELCCLLVTYVRLMVIAAFCIVA